MNRIALLFLLALVLGLVPAIADIEPVGPPVEGGSWSQLWTQDKASVDQIIVRWLSGPSTFEPRTFQGFDRPSWTQGYDSPNLSQALSSVSTSSLNFTLHFTGNTGNSIMFNLWELNGGTVQEGLTFAYKADLPGYTDSWGDWKWVAQTNPVPVIPTPEPAALLLLGIMGAVVLGVPRLLREK